MQTCTYMHIPTPTPRHHPAHNTASPATTATSTTTVSAPEEVVSTEDGTAPVSDAPIEVTEEVKEEVAAAVKEVEDVVEENKVEVDLKEEPEPKVEAKTTSPILIKNKLRPKFQVPKSLQGRVHDQVVVEKEDKKVGI